jgi:phospholipid-binding lipoprotein MlaA
MMQRSVRRACRGGAGLLAGLLAALVLLLAGGCATPPEGAPNRQDPWERFNRGVFGFNETVDRVALKPAAQAYQAVVPQPVRSGVDNMLGNVGDLWSTVNLALQAKPKAALDMGLRVAVNTTFGIVGLFDVAEEAGLERSSVEDFGQTLGRWGVRSGPYLVLPVLGPSTLRDTASLSLDLRGSGPSLVLAEPRDRNPATVLRLLNTRLRDAYLARRRNLIFDGDPPEDDLPPPPPPAGAASAPAVPASAVPTAADAPAPAASR